MGYDGTPYLFDVMFVQRKIIHIDMDAFYASVEQRDNPALRHKPVIVAWESRRSVVCAASYEARPFGVHSAMSAARARQLCPEGLFVPPDFARYKAVSRQIHDIFAHYTDRIEPLSLDEAYLDVTAAGKPATSIAREIREKILKTTHLTASAGVAPSKFLAKIASDWNKPDGLTVIKPQQVRDFLTHLEVKRIPGVGRVMQARLKAMGIETVGQLRQHRQEELARRFGRWGWRLYDLARGIDNRPVEAHRENVQVSTESTFEEDRLLHDLLPVIEHLAQKTWAAQARHPGRLASTVTLKLRTSDFHTVTRSYTPGTPPLDANELARLACALIDRVDYPENTTFRLAGVGLSGFIKCDEAMIQPDLFSSSP